MDKISKIPSDVQSSITPRIDQSKEMDPTGEETSLPKKRVHAPKGKAKIEFFDHQAYESRAPIQKFSAKKGIHSKRADQLNVLLLALAFVVLAVVIVGMILNSQKYSLKKTDSRHSTEASVDFYQGNSVYAQKVEEERAAKESSLRGRKQNDFIVGDPTEISIEDQTVTMNRKIEEMRAKKLKGEAPRPLPDTGPISGILPKLKPAKMENFNTPLDLNGALPKSLQTNQ
jgi:hypothetical protein